jgi:hypothetical protein
MQQQPIRLDTDELATATLKIKTWNIISAGLQELPMKTAKPILDEIYGQLNPQIMAAVEKLKKKEVAAEPKNRAARRKEAKGKAKTKAKVIKK